MALRDPNLQVKYKIFGKEVVLPKGFFLPAGVSLSQNKKSVEEGFKKLEKWLKNPTPQNWNKIFGKNNTFGLQLRAYLLDEPIDLRKGTGLKETSKKLFDELNVKKLIKPAAIEKINKLTTGGKGENLLSLARVGKQANLKFSMEEVKETIKTHPYGEKWLKANPDPNKIGPDGKNIWREYANTIRQMTAEQKKLGGFPYGRTSAQKLWANLYRASYRGDRIKILGEFADGKLPVDSKGNINWNLKNKAGIPAWQRVKFQDLEAPKKPVFKWDYKAPDTGGLKNQIDNALGKGKFVRATRAYDTGVWLGAEKIDGRSVKDIFREKILRNELLTKPLVDEKGRRTSWKDKLTPTEAEYKKYLKSKAPRFSLTEVHHPYGVGVDPYTSESSFRYANRALGRLEQSFGTGAITRAQYLDGIKKVNEEVGGIRAKVGSTFKGSKATSADQVFKEALRFVGKEDVPVLRNLLVKAAETNDGGVCNIFRAEGGRIGYAAGSSCVKQMETAFDTDPVRTTEQINKIKTVPEKIKTMGTGFLNFAKKGGKYGAIAAAGAATAGLVKTFMNDDPTTYLSNEDQQKNMLISMVTDPIDETPEESPAILDYQLPTLGAVTAAGMVPGGKRVYDVRRRGGPNLKPAGPVRSALGLKGVLGKGLAATASPLGLAALEPLHIAGQIAQGDSPTDIATNPWNYLGPTFAAPLTKEATRFTSPMVSKIMRMGMSPTALRGLSRFGGYGLAASLGIQGLQKFDDWRNKRGWFSEE